MYRANKEAEIREDLIDSLAAEYYTILDTLTLRNLDLAKADTSSQYAQTQLIKSPLPEISFTIKDFADELLSLPEPRRQGLDTYEERKQYLTGKMGQNLMYYDALQRGYEEHPDLRQQLSRIKFVGVLREYYKRNVADKVTVSDEEVREVYEKDKDEKYRIPASATVYQFVSDNKETLQQVYQKAINSPNTKDEDELAKLVEGYSVPQVRSEKLGRIYEGGSIPGLGIDSIYVNKIFSTPEGEFSDIFQNKNGEYVFFKVLSYTPASYREFNQVAPTIKNRLYQGRQEERFAELQERVKEKYNLRLYPEKLEKKLPVDSLYRLAEEKMAKEQYSSALRYYDQIIKYYPNGKDDYKATFMKGFIYSEYLNNPEKAKEAFESVLTYPEGDLHESARYMLKALKGEDDVIEKINP
jgi:tetratricopeptide (TPR) repeat protein